jgi:endonuclease/exonuclease/phosphatase (EEP) superfamily protein YafD
MLKLITYNIEEGKNLPKIYAWISKEHNNVDIICFQEFPEKDLNQNNEFLNKYKRAYAPGLKKRSKQLGQLTLYRKNIKLVEEFILDLGQDDLEVLYRKIPTKRSALITTFEINKRQFIVANIHLSAFSFNLNRRRQLKKIIEGFTTSVSVIMLGDFNYSNLFGRRFFIKYMENMGLSLAGDKMITNKYKKLIKQQLDYVFYTGFKLSDINVKEQPFSDHYPVIVNFELK